jgi:nucleotide-binding universal stress UspA family protein
MRILHPTDFSDCATNAEQHAVKLARAFGAEVMLVHVVVEAPPYRENLFGAADPRAFYDAQRAWATRTLTARAERIREATGLATRPIICTGAPAREIAAVAEREGIDLIVLGTHGRGHLDRLLVGSVADRLVRTAPCPVMTVRAGAVKDAAA